MFCPCPGVGNGSCWGGSEIRVGVTFGELVGCGVVTGVGVGVKLGSGVGVAVGLLVADGLGIGGAAVGSRFPLTGVSWNSGWSTRTIVPF